MSGLISDSLYGLSRQADAEPLAAPAAEPRAAEPPGRGSRDGRSRDTVCWQCKHSVDCEIARMCLTHPTGAARLAAVVRAIRAMREQLAEPLSLGKLAHAAMLSPFHFHRVFRHVTATTPARYLAALRMAEAKRLLVRSPLSVTEICGAVGYASLGTFTSQFTRLVGTSPRQFRELMTTHGGLPVGALLATLAALAALPSDARVPTAASTGRAARPRDGSPYPLGPAGTVGGGPAGCLVVVGLFDSGVPQRRPAACAIVPSPGFATLGPTPDGAYHLLAMAFEPDATVEQALADHRAPVRHVGSGRRPVIVRHGRTSVNFDVTVRRPRYTDPPLVMALPLLMAAQASTLIELADAAEGARCATSATTGSSADSPLGWTSSVSGGPS